MSALSLTSCGRMMGMRSSRVGMRPSLSSRFSRLKVAMRRVVGIGLLLLSKMSVLAVYLYGLSLWP